MQGQCYVGDNIALGDNVTTEVLITVGVERYDNRENKREKV